MDLVEKARDLLRNQRFAVVATAATGGEPWVTPVFYNYDAAYRLVWESARDARHSQNIAANPLAAVVVTDLTPDDISGVYFDCSAQEVPAARLEEAIQVLVQGPHSGSQARGRTPEDYMGEKPLRIYEATPLAVYALIQRENPDGYMMDERVEIDLGSGQAGRG